MPRPPRLLPIVSRTRHLLLDFDGPICSIFAGLPAATIADRLRKLLGDQAQLPSQIAHTEDPFEVFAYAATISEGRQKPPTRAGVTRRWAMSPLRRLDQDQIQASRSVRQRPRRFCLVPWPYAPANGRETAH
jgi:hypothetical protein